MLPICPMNRAFDWKKAVHGAGFIFAKQQEADVDELV